MEGLFCITRWYKSAGLTPGVVSFFKGADLQSQTQSCNDVLMSWCECFPEWPPSLTDLFPDGVLFSPPSAFGSMPCLVHTCPCNVKSTSCIDLSVSELGPRPPSRPRVLLKAPTLAEMEEMNISEVRRWAVKGNHWTHCSWVTGLITHCTDSLLQLKMV